MEQSKKESFLIYTSFYKPISILSDRQLGRLFRAIFKYQLGEVVDVEEDIRMAFEFFKNQFEIDESKYQSKIKRDVENGHKGGNPNFKKGKSNPYYDKGKKGMPQDNPNITQDNPRLSDITQDKAINDNVNDNDKETVSTNVEPVKKGANAPKERAADAATHEPHRPSERYSRFQQWLAKECPYIPKHFEKTISEREFEKLLETYSARQLCDVISEINNRGDLRKRYTDLYRTVLNWLKRENTPKT